MLPLVGWEPERSSVFSLTMKSLYSLKTRRNSSPTSAVAARDLQMSSAPVISDVSPKEQVGVHLHQLVDRIPNRGVGRETRVVSDSPHFTRDIELIHGAFGPQDLGGPVHVLFGLSGGHGDRLDVAVPLDRKALDGFAGLRDPFHDPVGPLGLDADHHDCRYVGVSARPDHGPEKELQVFSELEPSVGMRERQRPFDIVCHGLACGVGKIIQREDDHVVPDPTRPFSRRYAINLGVFIGYHLLVLRL